MELLGRRGELAGTSVVTASTTTERLATAMGFEVIALDGSVRVDLLIDGADEVAPDLGLMKGHGAALLREKLVAVAARRFVVVAEAAKRVRHLGEQRTLPVEVVRFAWADTRRRLVADLADVAVDVELRTTDTGDALVTDEGHHLLHVELVRDGADVRTLATRLSTTAGVVEHGLFLDLADEVLLGSDDGGVEVLRR
jgi:ribose 5-phosphate isomerase A